MMPAHASARWIDDRHFQLADIVFTLCANKIDEPCIKKNRSIIEHYLRLRQTQRFDRIIEVGILWGGSTIFFNEAFKPRSLLALDAKDQTGKFFHKYLETERGKTVSAHLNLLQDQREELAALADEVFGPAKLDLIIDDASHLYLQSVATFETLFPRLRPGGLYIVEDWGWAHWPGVWQTEKAPWRQQPSLANMVFETILACASRQGLVSRVEVTPSLVSVERGAAPGATLSLRSSFFSRGREYTPYL